MNRFRRPSASRPFLSITPAFVFAFAAAALIALAGAPALARPVSVDDIIAIQAIDRADMHPQSSEIAVVIARKAGPGEVFGRNAYEIDPSRSDIWLVGRDGSDPRPLTQGKESAAGFWCPHWSPDGKRLAMLSTAPQGNERRGGDNVRLYVWERDVLQRGESAPTALRRLSQRAVRAQERFGGALAELDLRAPGAVSREVCRQYQENAPFVWLSPTRLLAVMMPDGERSPMMERYPRVHREAAMTGEAIGAGQAPTLSRSDSALPVALTARGDQNENAYRAELVIFDLAKGTQRSLGFVPAFPAFGALTIAVSPDAKRAGILAPRRAIAPHLRARPRLNFGTWDIDLALYLADLEGDDSNDSALTPIAPPPEARYPVDIAGWSPDSKTLTLRARETPARNIAGLWTLRADTGVLRTLTPEEHAGGLTAAQDRPASFVAWAGNEAALVYTARAGDDAGQGRWRRYEVESGVVSESASSLEGFRSQTQLPNGTLAGNSAQGPARYDPKVKRFDLWPPVAQAPCDDRGALISDYEGGRALYTLLTSDGPLSARAYAPSRARVLDYDCTGLVILENGFEGSFVRFIEWGEGGEGAEPTTLVERNTHLATRDWGERRLIDYTHEDGRALQMAAIFPPGYNPAKRYPTILWVYGGWSPRSVDNFQFDPHIFAPHNLYTVAARGYVVVIPSIPIPRGEEPSEPFGAIPGGVLPALDELVRLGIADESRVGVMGHSFGGYTVNALVAQTNRFAAAVSMAGASDLATNHAVFDPTARGWPGIEQDFAYNDGIYETAIGLRRDPGEDPALYHRNSPLTHVDAITTPLLLIHGELDMRAPLAQPETLYSLLRRRGRPARLLRYWGENHSLANSPANARHMAHEMMDWFDHYLANEPEHTKAEGK